MFREGAGAATCFCAWCRAGGASSVRFVSGCQIIILLKAPRAGFVKTRLAAALGPHGALAAYRAVVERVLVTLSPLRDVELRFAPDDAGSEISTWLRPGWRATPQGEGDLGARMSRAFDESFASQAGNLPSLLLPLREIAAPVLHCVHIGQHAQQMHTQADRLRPHERLGEDAFRAPLHFLK